MPDVDPAIEARAASSRRPLGPFLLRSGLGLALLAFFLWLYGAAPIARVLARERLSFFGAAVLLYVAGQLMSSYRWMLLARLNGLTGRWREYAAYYFIGMFTNLFVPGLIGGDAARATYLGLRMRQIGSAVASVVADRAVGLVALFWFAAIAAGLVTTIRLPAPLIRAVVMIALLSFAGYLASPWLARPVLRLPGRLGKTAAPMVPYLRRPTGLIAPLLLSFVLQASLAIGQYLLAVGMGLPIALSVILLVVPIANVAASLPLTLNGLGVREGAYVLLFGMAGVAHPDAIAMGLLWFACTMLGGLTGVLPFVFMPVPRTSATAD